MTPEDVPMVGDDPTELGTAMLPKEEEARRLRLRTLRVKAKYKSAREAAIKLRLPESTYRSHENGSRSLTEQSAVLYAEKFNISYNWLWDGQGSPEPLSHRGDESPLPNATFPVIPVANNNPLLPIRGRAEGGCGGAIVLDGSIMDHLAGPSNLDVNAGAYGIEVVGESMSPRYRPGEIVWVNPSRAVHKGDCAVLHVRQPNGELYAYVKEYVRHSNGHVVVRQFNPDEELRFNGDDVEATHLIVGTGIR